MRERKVLNRKWVISTIHLFNRTKFSALKLKQRLRLRGRATLYLIIWSSRNGNIPRNIALCSINSNHLNNKWLLLELGTNLKGLPGVLRLEQLRGDGHRDGEVAAQLVVTPGVPETKKVSSFNERTRGNKIQLTRGAAQHYGKCSCV